MAHRIEFTKDITLPHSVEEYRLKLEKQIRELRERQELLSEEHKQKILMLEKRLLHGKKKIFSFDKKMNHMTLTDQLAHYNLEVEALKKAIAREEQIIRDREKEQSSPLPDLKLQYFPSRMILPGIDQEENAERNISSPLMKRTSLSMVGIDPLKMSSGSDKSLRLITDPQEELLKLTHEIMRLKKSLQEVRSKYSDNFTEYKLRQEYEKLKEHNAVMTQELKQLETTNIINQHKQTTNNDVDYGEMETITLKREYELALKDKRLLEEYLQEVEFEKREREESDNVKMMDFNEKKINMLRREVEEMEKNNLIVQNELLFVEKEIKEREMYQQRLRANLPM